MDYLELFIAPVPSTNRAAYEKMAATMMQVHKDLGALEVSEFWGADIPDGEVTSFPKAVDLAEGETVACGWIRWPSKAVRDAAYEKMMEHPLMEEVVSAGFPFDGKRLILGGFDPLFKE